MDKLKALLKNDKVLHGLMGLGTMAGTFAAIWIANHVSLGAALAFTTTAGGVAVELYQRVRKEGTPDILDAAAMAAPGWVGWGVLMKFF